MKKQSQTMQIKAKVGPHSKRILPFGKEKTLAQPLYVSELYPFSTFGLNCIREADLWG